MAVDVRNLFNTDLRLALARNSAAAIQIGGVYQLRVDGVGTWGVDLSHYPPSVVEGLVPNPGVDIGISAPDFQLLLANPRAEAMKMFFSGRLRVKGNTAMAMQLEKVLALLR